MRFSISNLGRAGWPAGVLALLLAVGDANAQGEIPERYQLSIIQREMRAYFDQLSDSEYASLQPGPALFPLLIKIWPEQPLTTENALTFPTPTVTEDEAALFQQYLLDKPLGPMVRSGAINELASTTSPLAAEMILRQLGREGDSAVVADCLKMLTALKVSTLSADSLMPFLDSPDAQVRFHAAGLYVLQGEAPVQELLKRAVAESEIMLKRHLLETAAVRARETQFEEWLPFWQHEEPMVRLSAMAPILQFSRAHELQEEILEICQSDWQAGKRRLAETLHNRLNPEFCDAILRVLVSDGGVSVRAGVAEAVGRLQLPNLQPLLTRLAGDAHAAVRLETARSLGRFANEESYEVLVRMSHDPRSLLVRQATRDALIALAGPFPVAVRIGGAIESESVFTRNVAFQVISTLRTEVHRQAIARQLAKETRPENIANAILALARGDGRNASEQILTFADHESPAVRAAVAEAIGSLRIAAGKPALILYGTRDKHQIVRSPAIAAMGILGDAQFGEPLLSILKRTRIESPDASSELDRAIACWSLARLEQVDKAVLNRVVDMVTKMVIATQMGPMYDGDLVRVSAAWCIVDLARRDVRVEGFDFGNQSQVVIDMLKLEDPRPGDGISMSMPPPTSDMLRAYGAELESFLNGESIHRAPVPASATSFSFHPFESQTR